MYDVNIQYHRDELAKKQLLEQIIGSINTSTASILPELQSIGLTLDGVKSILQSIDSNVITITSTISDNTQTTQIVQTISPASIALTELAVTAGNSGSVSANALYVTFLTSNDFTGTIGGISIPNLAVKDYPYIPGFVYPSISYQVSTGTLYIIQARA